MPGEEDVRKTTQQSEDHPERRVAIEGPDIVIGGDRRRQRDEPDLFGSGLGGSPERAESLPALGSESRKNKSKHFGGGGKNLRLNVTAKFAELTDGRRAKSSMEIALGAARALKPGMCSGAG